MLRKCQEKELQQSITSIVVLLQPDVIYMEYKC